RRAGDRPGGARRRRDGHRRLPAGTARPDRQRPALPHRAARRSAPDRRGGGDVRVNWLLILLPALPLAGAAALATPAFRGRTGIGWGTGVSGLVLAGAVGVAGAIGHRGVCREAFR